MSFEFFYRFLLSPRAGSLVKTISRICIVGVWLGVTALIVVVSVMNGFNQSIHERLLEVEPHMQVRIEGLRDYREIKNHPVYQKLKTFDVELMSPMVQQDVILRTEEGFIQHAIAQGVTKERLHHLLDFVYRRSGREEKELREKIDQLKPGEVLLGMGLADSTGIFYDNQFIVMPPELLLMPASERTSFHQVTTKGFVSTDTPRIDERGLFYLIDHGLARVQGGASEQIGLEVWLKDPNLAQKYKNEIQMDGVVVETWEDRNASLFFALKMEKFVVSFLVSLSTLIAGLSIISVMVLLVTQKRKDIGNLLAMGMTKIRIQNLFIFIGMFLALTGVVAGVLSGTLGSVLIDNYSQDVLPAFYEETNIPAQVKAWHILLILFVSSILSYIVLRVTMGRLTHNSPSELLRR